MTLPGGAVTVRRASQWGCSVEEGEESPRWGAYSRQSKQASERLKNLRKASSWSGCRREELWKVRWEGRQQRASAAWCSVSWVLAGVWSAQVPVQDGDRGSGGLLTVFVRETRSREV